MQQRLPIGREVSLNIKTTDRYGRSVAEVISESNINLALVEDGKAFAYRQYLSGCDAKAYLEAEERASRARLGVWQVPGGITRPWDFRRGRRSAAIPDGTTQGGLRYRCKEIGSYAKAQELLRQGHSYLDGNGDGEACESLRLLEFWWYWYRYCRMPPPPEKWRTLKLRGGPVANPTLTLHQSPARDHPSRCTQRRCDWTSQLQ